MAGDQVTEQEVAVHVFVPLDGTRAADGVASLTAMWGRFRELQHADSALYAALPTAVPDPLRPPPRGTRRSWRVCSPPTVSTRRSCVGTGRSSTCRSCSAPVRTVGGRCCGRLDAVLGPLGPGHLGASVLELGKLPEDTPGDVDLSEPEDGGAPQLMRSLRMLGRVGADARLGAWAWSEGRRPEMPHFVRYLMHMAAVAHQARTYRWLADARDTGTREPLAVVREPDGRDRHVPSTAELHYLRDSVDGARENARRALEASGLDGGSVTKDDRRYTASFLSLLDDILARLKQNGIGDPLAGPRREAGRPVRVLAVADEWFPAHGGLSAFNSRLCAALARQRADVRVTVLASTPEERADAARHGVRLIDVAQPGLTGDAALSVPPPLTDGFVPDLVIGHGKVTGAAAKMLVERHFRNAGRLHFLHVEPDQAEAHKPHAKGDMAARAEERTDLELRLCRDALHPMPVGPRLERALRPHLRSPWYQGLAEPVRIDPGFDDGTPVTPPGPGRSRRSSSWAGWRTPI